MTHSVEFTPADHALRVLAQTTSAWRVAPVSPREVARRAPHGYVPVRLMRRLHAAAVAAMVASQPTLAHSW